MAVKSANNVSKMGVEKVFKKIAQDLTVELIMRNKDILMKLEPDKAILPKWEGRFKKLLAKAEKIKINVYGERNETPMQKLGFKIANDLVEKYIASGKLYDGKIAIRIKNEEKLKNLIEFSELLLNEDSKVKEFLPIEEKKEVEEETQNKNQKEEKIIKKEEEKTIKKEEKKIKKEPDQVGRSSCCKIF